MSTIILPLDGSASAEEAIPQALARCAPRDRLLLVRVACPDASWEYQESHFAELDLRAARAYLADVAAHLATPPGVQLDTLVVVGSSPHEQIAATARAQGADLLVLASHGRTGWKRLVLGSVAERVAREAPCPVWMVRCRETGDCAKPPAPPSTVLLPVESAEEAERAQNFVCYWLTPATRLVWLAPPTVEPVASGAGWTCDLRRVDGRLEVAGVLEAAAAEGAELILMTRRDRADQVLRRADCPVVLVGAYRHAATV